MCSRVDRNWSINRCSVNGAQKIKVDTERSFRKYRNVLEKMCCPIGNRIPDPSSTPIFVCLDGPRDFGLKNPIRKHRVVNQVQIARTVSTGRASRTAQSKR